MKYQDLVGQQHLNISQIYITHRMREQTRNEDMAINDSILQDNDPNSLRTELNIQQSGPRDRNCCQDVDRKQLIRLIVGVTGIIVMFSLSSLMYEALIKRKYRNWKTGEFEKCSNPYGLTLMGSIVVFLLGSLYNFIFVKQKTVVPIKEAAACGGLMVFGNVMTIYAVQLTSYPVVIVFKACSVLSVILVGVCCSSVEDKKLKLGRNKIVAAVLITICIILFQFFDPERKNRSVKTEFLGVLFLTCSIVSDGFYPDFQARIKSIARPAPTEMMVKINATMIVFAGIPMIVSMTAFSFFQFMYYHLEYLGFILLSSTLAFIGQIFVYNMIKQFKQHIVPFTVTTRKFMSVFWSILYYHHATNWIQIVSVIALIVIVCWQFKVEVSRSSLVDLLDSKEQDSEGQASEYDSHLQTHKQSISNPQTGQSSVEENEIPSLEISGNMGYKLR